MKKMLCALCALSLVLAVLLLTVWRAEADDALRRGNIAFGEGAYQDAFQAYEEGLSKNPEGKALYFSAAQTAYLLGDYERADEYFAQAADLPEKFLSAGNIYYKSGEASEDAEQKAALYAQALEHYETGMKKYPENIPLKFNYEFVIEKLSALAEETQDELGDQGEDEDEQEQESSGEDDSAEEEQGSQQESADGEADQEAVERVLQMLEDQEEQSLKNNREVTNENDGKNGW